ncbi:MAG: tetratricopeptide repeat protein [Bacteroidetes bacterium]|nr:tetratricopeptide repeat protein [Bacteroidota bacterium]
MKRLSVLMSLLLGSVLLIGADGCSSDPNVEGAKLDLRNKDYDRALQNLETALVTNPDNTDALELKGRVLGEKAFTIQNIEEHAALIAEMVESYGRAVALDSTLADAVTLSLRIAFSREFQLGIQAFNRGSDDQNEYNTAATYFGTASVIQPDSSGAYVNQAYALMRADRPNDAIAPFEMALERGDTQEDTYRFLAGLYQANDQDEEAVTLLETASGRYPDNVDVQTELLNAYQLAGQIDRAMSMYEGAVREDPANKLFRYNYGSMLVLKELYDEAIVQLSAAVELDPEYGNAQYNMGAAYINKAVNVNDRINEIDDEVRAKKDELSDDEEAEMNAEIDRLAEERKGLFGQAIAPLEAARVLYEASGEDATEVCQALFQSYVQTGQTELAQGVSECAGYDDLGDSD